MWFRSLFFWETFGESRGIEEGKGYFYLTKSVTKDLMLAWKKEMSNSNEGTNHSIDLNTHLAYNKLIP